MTDRQEWSRANAEERIREVFDDAKSGEPQIVRDGDGKFEIRFVANDGAETLGQYLARGGPDKD